MNQNNNTKVAKPKMSLFSVVMLALSSIIGSGWLFGAWEASKVSGPAAIISWVIGAIVIGIIAYVYIELGTMFPESGGMSKYAGYTHGPLLGFIASWANWVSLVTLLPIEAVAAVQYMSSWPWAWANWTNHFVANGTVTTEGLMMVFLFILVFTLLNYWSVNLLTRFTSLTSIFKLVVPSVTIIMLLISGFHPSNFTNHNFGGFLPYGTAPIFAATTVSGIIFSYNAFQTVINVGDEITNPKKNIWRGIVIALFASIVIYIMLQFTFIGAIDPAMLAKHGWHGINFESPFADLAIMLNINWLVILLYLDAFVSPFGTGVSFVASTSRTLAAMTQNGHMPKILGKINQKWGTPRIAMVANWLISCILVSIFKNWAVLASVISTSTLIAYVTGPVTLMALRKHAPEFKRPVTINFAKVVAPLAFILASLAIYWAMWPTTMEVIVVIALGLPFYLFYEDKLNWKNSMKKFKGSLWMLFYLAFMSAFSYVGSTPFGGQNWIHYPYDFLVIIAVSLGFYYWGVNSYQETKEMQDAKNVNNKVKNN
ncbi:APC family permease [Lactobacillus sanfranciscensis]|nr:APC family permease [Fructilactobacillus sanfranciscensis]MDN4462157.1 APC family permease [Fructilactobacillus sanfranciscensis]NDR61713.1 APC family permease [Fructilactobacillus sanfranciscensis]NDR75671.1 APC family permease [Fructilactobacillus sanfranciscensis]NDR96525.1 APC family permease [Fructilactobacillus sanfranciscensis]NDS04346.1 APC family permease [Fructilactobacillus sanfranciscensis]